MNTTVEAAPAKALELIEQGALLIDVREPEEVADAAFDVPGVMLIPFSRFEQRFREIPSDRQVIIGCRSGSRSMMATRFLMNQGYDKAINLQRGIMFWEQKGFPVKRKPQRHAGGWDGASASDSLVKRMARFF